MLKKINEFLRAPVFPDDEKTQRAGALHALHLNMSLAILVLGGAGVLFFFEEKFVTSLILIAGLLVTALGILLNRRGFVQTAGILMLAFLWILTVFMTVLSSGIQSLDIMFLISGTVMAGIILGTWGAYFYAGLSLLTGLGLVIAGNVGFEFFDIFAFPPISIWILLFINIAFTVIPLQVALKGLSDAAVRARASEERYRLITSVVSDYVFSERFNARGEISDQWVGGAFEAITGYPPTEFFARGGWVSIVHPDDRERDQRDMSELRNNHQVISEVRIVCKDGHVRWVRSYGHPIWDEKENRLAGIYGAVQDITAQKRADTELLQRAEDVSLLYRLGVALSGGQNLYQALRSFADELKQVMALDAFHIGLYDEQTDIFSYTLFLNLGEDIQPPPRKLSENPGLTHEVIANRQTLYLADLTDPKTQREHNILWVVEAPIHSYIGIPLLLQDRVIGIMSVQAVNVDAYTSDQIRLLETIAAQVAITIEKMSLLDQVQKELAERTRAETELQQREAIMDVVADAANTFLKTSQWNETVWQRDVHRLLERLGTTINASHAYMFENSVDENAQIRMSLRYEWVAPGFKSDLENPLYKDAPLDEEYTEYWKNIITHGLPYIGDQEHIPADESASFQRRGYHAILDVPIFVDGIWWGTIGFDEMIHPRNWSNAEVSALVVAANLLGAVIKRRQMDSALQTELGQRKTLIEELKQRNTESETLRESAAIVAASLERSETLSLILEQIEKVVFYDSASIQLLIGDMLEIVGSRKVERADGDIGMRFPLNEDEPAYPVLQGTMPYILYEDVQVSIPAFNEIPHMGIHAWLAVPLKVKGNIIGIIALDGIKIGQFTERDAKLAVTYASQVAVALENSRLFSELQVELSLKQNLIGELENKNAELERITYTVSHDLRSPLVTIRGFLGYLERDAENGNMENFRKDMQRISNATIRMDRLLKDILELSRIGRIINKPQDVPFEILIKDAVEMVHGRLEKHGVTLHTQPNLPPVHVDRPRLTEVLQNLIDNAAKYMGDQTEPVIEIGMDGYDASGMPVFFVRDNGMGVAPEYHERIFKLFDKLDVASEGTGVGLALVKRIIEFHGGRIWIQSEAGGGSTFYFTLPLPNL